MENSNKNIKGFTLVETIVVIAVFFVVLGAATGIFISIIQNQRRILAEQELLNQASYAIEHMSKAMRMARKDADGTCLDAGYDYMLTRQNSNGVYQGIKFINQSDNDACYEFFLDTDTGVLKEIKNGGDAVALTSEKMQINFMRFSINGSDGTYGADKPSGASENDTVQPRITIVLDVQLKGDESQPSKRIQTTVSQRNLNLE